MFAQPGHKKVARKKDNFVQQTAHINKLLKQYGTLSPFSERENSAELIDSLKHEIVAGLLKVLNNPLTLNQPIERLIVGDDLYVSFAPDRKVYFLSVDEKTGGSFRSNQTIIWYALPGGKVKAGLFEGDEPNLLTPLLYDAFLVDSITRTYLAIGNVQTCNTCIAYAAVMLQPDSNGMFTQIITRYAGAGLRI